MVNDSTPLDDENPKLIVAALHIENGAKGNEDECDRNDKYFYLQNDQNGEEWSDKKPRNDFASRGHKQESTTGLPSLEQILTNKDGRSTVQ